jgi:hypothetical protein
MGDGLHCCTSLHPCGFSPSVAERDLLVIDPRNVARRESCTTGPRPAMFRYPRWRVWRGLATSFGAATLLRLSLRSFCPGVPDGPMFPSSVPACAWVECPAPDRFHRAFDRRCLRLRSEGRSIRNIQPSLPGFDPATEPHEAVPHHGQRCAALGFAPCRFSDADRRIVVDSTPRRSSPVVVRFRTTIRS